VSWRSGLYTTLDQVEDEHLRAEIRESVVDKHLALWRLLVLVDRVGLRRSRARAI
jgi:hypothetical protein